MTNIQSKVRWIILIGAGLLALFLLATLIDNSFETTPRNKERAQLIINAVYAYKQQNGNFPKVLDDLRPDFLKEIPSTLDGASFFYSTDSVEGFGIVFFC